VHDFFPIQSGPVFGDFLRTFLTWSKFLSVRPRIAPNPSLTPRRRPGVHGQPGPHTRARHGPSTGAQGPSRRVNGRHPHQLVNLKVCRKKGVSKKRVCRKKGCVEKKGVSKKRVCRKKGCVEKKGVSKKRVCRKRGHPPRPSPITSRACVRSPSAAARPKRA
jgi:hypothetical protein